MQLAIVGRRRDLRLSATRAVDEVSRAWYAEGIRRVFSNSNNRPIPLRDGIVEAIQARGGVPMASSTRGLRPSPFWLQEIPDAFSRSFSRASMQSAAWRTARSGDTALIQPPTEVTMPRGSVERAGASPGIDWTQSASSVSPAPLCRNSRSPVRPPRASRTQVWCFSEPQSPS